MVVNEKTETALELVKKMNKMRAERDKKREME